MFQLTSGDEEWQKLKYLARGFFAPPNPPLFCSIPQAPQVVWNRVCTELYHVITVCTIMDCPGGVKEVIFFTLSFLFYTHLCYYVFAPAVSSVKGGRQRNRRGQGLNSQFVSARTQLDRLKQLMPLNLWMQIFCEVFSFKKACPQPLIDLCM